MEGCKIGPDFLSGAATVPSVIGKRLVFWSLIMNSMCFGEMKGKHTLLTRHRI